jgi:hypothetical protein
MRVVKADKELMLLPIISLLATIVSIGAVIGISFPFWPRIFAENGSADPIAMVFAFTLYIVTAFVATFFHAATVSGANERLSGGDPTLGSSIKGAARRIVPIFFWSIVLATVNVILQMLRERSGFVGRMLASVGGLAWNLATYFVVPFLVVEDKKIGESIKGSAAAFKKTWGESVVGEVGIGFVLGLVWIPIILIAIILGYVVSLGNPIGGLITGIATILVLGGFLLVFQYTVSGVYRTALFRYATTGEAPWGFEEGQLANAYHAK